MQAGLSKKGRFDGTHGETNGGEGQYGGPGRHVLKIATSESPWQAEEVYIKT